MAASAEISLRDVAKALQPLKRDQLISLFVELQVPLHALDNSVSDCKGSEVRIRYSQAWLDHDPEANLEKLSAALKQIGKLSLAEEIGPQSRVGRALAPQAVEDVTPDPVAPVEGVPEISELAPSVPSSLNTVATTTPSSPSSSSTTTDRVSQVRDTIDQLTDTFSDRMFDTQTEMCDKESKDPSFLNRFRCHLLGLPAAKKAVHVKFFRKSEDEFLKAENMQKIFAILTRYCDYSNPEILRELVRKFCEAVLQGKMQEYCEFLERFEKATTVDVFLVAISARKSLSLAFKAMTVKINKPPSVCTLHEIRMFKEDLAEKSSLHSYGMYIESVSESSVLVVLRFPPSCVGWVLAALTPDFMTTHLLTDVVVDEKQLAIEHTSQRKLVYWYMVYITGRFGICTHTVAEHMY